MHTFFFKGLGLHQLFYIFIGSDGRFRLTIAGLYLSCESC